MSRLWVWIVCGSGAAVLVGTFIVVRYVDRTPGPALPQPAIEVSQARPVGNPLLTAEKREVERWFPAWCFAEIYNKKPSFNGGLVSRCLQNVIDNVKADTGVVLTAAEVRSPEVVAHFRKTHSIDWGQP